MVVAAGAEAGGVKCKEGRKGGGGRCVGCC